jgi:4-carboxymuconolactone decarboxylase
VAGVPRRVHGGNQLLTEHHRRTGERGLALAQAGLAIRDPAWSERERAVIRLGDELHESAGVSDDVFAELERHFSAPQILELVIAGGWYHTISFVVNAARVQPEPWAARFPRATA